jgi:hypothetical protein
MGVMELHFFRLLPLANGSEAKQLYTFQAVNQTKNRAKYCVLPELRWLMHLFLALFFAFP